MESFFLIIVYQYNIVFAFLVWRQINEYLFIYLFIYIRVKGSVSWDFKPPIFSWFEPIWVSDKQAKVFLNLVSILPRYLITKFEKFDSAVCMRHTAVKILDLANKQIQICFLQIFSFMVHRCVHPLKDFSWLSL